MEKLSRVKKYEELREKIEQNDEDVFKQSSKLNEYASKLNNLDANFFKENNNVKVDHQPIREKTVSREQEEIVSNNEASLEEIEVKLDDHNIDGSFMNNIEEALMKSNERISMIDDKPDEKDFSGLEENILMNKFKNDVTNTDSDDEDDYINDYILEAKRYGIDTGIREVEDTQINILNQIRPVAKSRRADYTEELNLNEVNDVKEDNVVIVDDEVKENIDEILNKAAIVNGFNTNDVDDTMSINDLVNQINEFGNDDISNSIEHSKSYEEPVIVENGGQFTTSINVEKENLEKRDYEFEDYANNSNEETMLIRNQNQIIDENTISVKKENDNKMQRIMLEETQQLRMQLSEYEEEMSDISTNLNKNNRILNIILLILIVALLLVIGFTAYYVLAK